MYKSNSNLIHLFLYKKFVKKGALYYEQKISGIFQCKRNNKKSSTDDRRGSGFGNTVKELQSSAPDAVITEGRLLNCGTKQEISEWVNSL